MRYGAIFSSGHTRSVILPRRREFFCLPAEPRGQHAAEVHARACIVWTKLTFYQCFNSFLCCAESHHKVDIFSTYSTFTPCAAPCDAVRSHGARMMWTIYSNLYQCLNFFPCRAAPRRVTPHRTASHRTAVLCSQVYLLTIYFVTKKIYLARCQCRPVRTNRRNCLFSRGQLLLFTVARCGVDIALFVARLSIFLINFITPLLLAAKKPGVCLRFSLSFAEFAQRWLAQLPDIRLSSANYTTAICELLSFCAADEILRPEIVQSKWAVAAFGFAQLNLRQASDKTSQNPSMFLCKTHWYCIARRQSTPRSDYLFWFKSLIEGTVLV